MEMEEQYGITDLTHYMSGRPIFTAIPPPEVFSGGQHNHHVAQQNYEMVMGAGSGGMLFRGGSDSTNNTAASLTGTSTTASLSAGGGLEIEIGGGDGGGTGRWPRQETLTLLEVRSRLDSKFKEANQKGPLWDEVSRIMSEDHGYQRSGKKCREKFENLYKYYKKTKEGKAGRQDGKHYRFFRQLEALYGETSSSNNPITSLSDTHNNLIGTSTFQAPSQPNFQHEPFQAPPRLCCDSLSLSNSSAFDTSSSDSMENNQMKNRRGKRSWKVKIKDFIDSQMRKLMEKQEAWLEKMMKTIEHKEQERILREEEWRKEEAARVERERKFWANERAWMEARDAAFMEALHKLTKNNSNSDNPWEESEITRLMQLRRGMETSFRQGGCLEEVLWEEIAAKMACLGYDRNGLMCKAKWDSVNGYLAKTKRRKENRSSSYSYQVVANGELTDERSVAPNDHHHGASPSPPTTTSHVNENCYRFLMGDPENMWESYGMKLTKQGGENQ